MIIPLGAALAVYVRLDVGASFDSVAIGKSDGTLTGLAGTAVVDLPGIVTVHLAAGDTDVIGPITIILRDFGTNAIGQWYGVILADYPSTGDPFETIVPGAYVPGEAGYAVGHNLDAAVSSRLATSGYTAPNNAGIGTAAAAGLSIDAGLTAGTYQIQLTSAQFDALVAAAWQTADQIEIGFTAQEAMRLILSAAAAKLGIVGSVVKIRDVNDTKDRITATTDSIGQRTAVTTNVS
jgi:hypothetical protein